MIFEFRRNCRAVTIGAILLAAPGVRLYGQASISVTGYGAVGDGVMRTDGVMTAGSPTLTSPSGSFTSANVGKYIQVIGAGAGGTTRSDGVMQAGSAVLMSSSGTFASSDIGRGIVVPGAGPSGANLITSIAAVTSAKQVALNAAASRPVTAATYFYGAMTLESSIQSVQNSTTVTLANPALATISSAMYVYGTDDHAAFQAALDAAGQAGGGIVNVPQPSYCPASATCGYVTKASDQLTAYYPSAIKIRYNNVSLIGSTPQTNLFCRGAWNNYSNSVQFPGQTAAMRGDCIVVGDNGGTNKKPGIPIANVSIANLHLFGMTNGNTFGLSFNPTTAPLITTGDGWDITHKAIHLWDNSAFSNINLNNLVIQDFKGELIYSGGSIVTGMVISNSTLSNFNGDGISMLAASLQVLNNTISNGSNAGVENATMSSTSGALISQVYQGNNISLMAREGINVFGVDGGITTGNIQITGNTFRTIGQINGSGAQSAVYINPQSNGDLGPANVTVSNNTCIDCFAFGNLQTSGTTVVSGNSFVVDNYLSAYFLLFTFPQTNITISGNTGYRTSNAISNGRMLSSVYMLDPGYLSGNFNWSNLLIQNNSWNFPGIPNYTFATRSGQGFRILTGHNAIWKNDVCTGCTYPDVDHGFVNLASQSTIEPYGPVVYVGGNTSSMAATLDASKEQDGSQVTIVNSGSNPVIFTSDSNLSLTSPLTLAGGSMSKATFVYSGSVGKFVLYSPVTISVSPPSGTLRAGQSLQLTATVSGSTNTGVTWQLAGGGVGSVSAAGLYTAPASITTQQNVTIQAISAADNTQTATAMISLIPTVAITIAPSSTSLYAGQTVQFSASVSGSSNTAVTWQITAGTGTISASGLYTAPASVPSQQNVNVQATSVADTTKTANASITLIPVTQVTITPSSGSLSAGQTLQLSANIAVTWQILSGSGSISGDGLYTAPASIPAAQTVTIQATSTANSSSTATASIALNPTVAISVNPLRSSLMSGQTVQLSAVVTGTTNTAATWQVLSGGPGAVSSTGLYTAPATIVAAQSVTVQAASVANPSKTATAIIDLMPTPPATPPLSRVGTPAICTLGGNVNSGSCPYNATAGNFLVVSCSSQASQTAFQITDAKGNAYQRDGFSSRGVSTSLFHASGIAGGPVNPTCSAGNTAGNGLIITVTEYAGLPASTTLDGGAVSTAGTGSTIDTGSLTTTGPSDLLVGAAISNSVPNCNGGTATGGWTQIQFTNNQQSYCMVLADQLGVAPGGYGFTALLPNSGSWAAVFAAFK